MEAESVKYLSAALCMGLGSVGPALAQGIIGGKFMEAVGRNPKVSDTLFTKLIVADALAESIAIYALVISLIILFVS